MNYRHEVESADIILLTGVFYFLEICVVTTV